MHLPEHPTRLRLQAGQDEDDPAALAARLREHLARPIDFHIDQLRISLDPGAAEAAQIAAAPNGKAVDVTAARDRAVSEPARRW